jgi:hypothetical protein
VQIDSTPLDVLVLLDDGVPGRAELTAACARLVADQSMCGH